MISKSFYKTHNFMVACFYFHAEKGPILHMPWKYVFVTSIWQKNYMTNLWMDDMITYMSHECCLQISWSLNNPILYVNRQMLSTTKSASTMFSKSVLCKIWFNKFLSGGQLGSEATNRKVLQAKYYRHTLHKDIHMFCQSCHACHI